jgi:hypothetical protein
VIFPLAIGIGILDDFSFGGGCFVEVHDFEGWFAVGWGFVGMAVLVVVDSFTHFEAHFEIGFSIRVVLFRLLINLRLGGVVAYGALVGSGTAL